MPLWKNKEAALKHCFFILEVVSSGIEPEYQVPETCVLSVVLRDQFNLHVSAIATKLHGKSFSTLINYLPENIFLFKEI